MKITKRFIHLFFACLVMGCGGGDGGSEPATSESTVVAGDSSSAASDNDGWGDLACKP